MPSQMMLCPRCWGSTQDPDPKYNQPNCSFCAGAGAVPDIKLSKFFWASELIRSDTAIRKGIPNAPPFEYPKSIIDNMIGVCTFLGDPIREEFGPIHINSGLRFPTLNDAIGGSRTSAHRYGLALDLRGSRKKATIRNIVNWIVSNKVRLNYDQVIYEGTWVHAGLRAPNGKIRNQDLMMFNVGGKSKYWTYDPSDPRVV